MGVASPRFVLIQGRNPRRVSSETGVTSRILVSAAVVFSPSILVCTLDRQVLHLCILVVIEAVVLQFELYVSE